MMKKLGKCGTPDLSYDDHGILTLYVQIDFGGASQGFGGYCLDAYDKASDGRQGSAAGMDFIVRLLKLFDVERLEEIKGRSVYALYEDDSFNSSICGLETPGFDGGKTFLVKNWQKKWFPKEALR